MYENERVLFRFLLHYARSLAEGIDESRFAERPAGLNPPLWLLGHLCIATDYAAGLLGLAQNCPAEWHKSFGPGSDPSAPPEPVPGKDDLLAALTAGVERVIAASGTADAATMKQRHSVPLDFLQKFMPSQGELLSHLMTTHMAGHVGQLSAWRRAAGLRPEV